jgi:hypothetical protein
MASARARQIQRQAQARLGPHWETGDLEDEFGLASLWPRPRGNKRVQLGVWWPTDEETRVVNGEHWVFGGGRINGWEVERFGTLDEVLAYLVQETPKLLAKKRKRWWRRNQR